MAPGAKFSTMTSARCAMFLTSSSPRSDFRLTVMDFLLALNNRKYQESWLWPDVPLNKKRPASPPRGFSTLTISAPSQASASVQDGPASNWVRSRTRTPERQLRGALFSVIAIQSSKAGAKSHDSAGDPATERRQIREKRQLMSTGDRFRIGVLGASGYTGAELLRLLRYHPQAEIGALTADRQAGKQIGAVFPHLAGEGLPDLVTIPEVDWSELDIVLCGLPHGTT